LQTLRGENQALREKMEERLEHLFTMKKKLEQVVNIRAHVREKIHHVAEQVHVLKGEETLVGNVVKEKQTVLRTLKQAIVVMKKRIEKETQSTTHLPQNELMTDYVKNQVTMDKLRHKLQILQQQAEMAAQAPSQQMFPPIVANSMR
jgi:hypothetical protein